MEIKVNGEIRQIKDESTLLDLINELGIEAKVMAAAVNMQIVKKEDWANAKLQDSDAVELLDFVGGG